jgi:hypothetical protein
MLLLYKTYTGQRLQQIILPGSRLAKIHSYLGRARFLSSDMVRRLPTIEHRASDLPYERDDIRFETH